VAATWQPSAIASCWHRTTTHQNYDIGAADGPELRHRRALRRPFEAPTGTGTLFGQTMGLVAVTAALFTVGAYLARDLSGGWGLVFGSRRWPACSP
jgi:hypothetical protein